MNKNRMRFIIPLILVTVIVGALLVVGPRFLSSSMSAEANGHASNTASRGKSAQSQFSDSHSDTASGIQIARADIMAGDDDATSTTVARQQRPLRDTGSTGTGSGEALATEDRSRLRAGNVNSRRVLGCAIEPDKTAEVGSPVVGVVSSIVAERGDRVDHDQELARLRANVEQASVAVAQARTQADAEVRAAQTNMAFLRQKLARAEELVELNFISAQALEEARTDARLAEERLAQAREQQRVWQKELNLANAQLQMRTIRAPFDGIIVDRYVSVGERIEDKALFRIIKTDPLRIEIVAPSTMFGTVSIGTVVKVMPELPNAPSLIAQVDLVDTVIDGASNTFRVRAKLPNPDGALPSGLRCRAELTDMPAPVSAPLPAAPEEELTFPDARPGLKVDTSLASMQRAMTDAAHLGNSAAPHKQ